VVSLLRITEGVFKRPQISARIQFTIHELRDMALNLHVCVYVGSSTGVESGESRGPYYESTGDGG
jgi:hypothetical protein